MTPLTLILVIFAVCLGLSGDVVFKRTPDHMPITGFLLYASSGFPIWWSYRTGAWMTVGVLWQALAVLLTICLGVFFFGEHLTSRKLLAFALALVAAWLAE